MGEYTQEVLDELVFREFVKNHPQYVRKPRSVAFYFGLTCGVLVLGRMVGTLWGI